MAYADNRSAAVSIDFDPEQVGVDFEAGVELGDWWHDWELDVLLTEPVRGWNPEPNSEASTSDIVDAVGYDLRSLWHGLSSKYEPRQYMLDLPPRPDNHAGGVGARGKTYSRTNVEAINRTIKTYMRPGNRFYEMCCGWMTFSSTAKYLGLSGRGSDIWDVAIDFCKRQLKAMPGLGEVDVVRADCRETGEPNEAYDLVHSNPPFFNLEPYGGDERDLSAGVKYGDWIDAMGEMGREAERILKTGGLANFVINDYRKGGSLVPMHADFLRTILNNSGMVLHDIVVSEVKAQAIRFRRQDYERQRTTKGHEYVITFRKVE
jgi:predicted RNA methylase